MIKLYNWDFDKLFADGNVIGIKNVYENKTYPWVIDKTEETCEENLDSYTNDNLTWEDVYITDYDDSYTTDFVIQYIVRLNDRGNVVERLFDRDRDMSKPMPELKNGMFGKVIWYKDGEFYPHEDTFGLFIVNNGDLIYQAGGFDHILEMECVKIVEIYNAYSFSNCRNATLVWRDPEYQEWLDNHCDQEAGEN